MCPWFMIKYILFYCIFPRSLLFFLSDHVLVGHVMNTSAVADEFECHQKCLRNNSCKSFNVHPGTDNTKRVCELNNKTRQTTQDKFKKKKGSSYYGHVKVRSTVWIWTIAFFTKLLIKKTKTQNNQLKHLFTTVTLNSNMRQQTSI